MLITGLDGIHEHSVYPRVDQMGAAMVLSDALRRIAETLEPPGIPDTPSELLDRDGRT